MRCVSESVVELASGESSTNVASLFLYNEYIFIKDPVPVQQVQNQYVTDQMFGPNLDNLDFCIDSSSG